MLYDLPWISAGYLCNLACLYTAHMSAGCQRGFICLEKYDCGKAAEKQLNDWDWHAHDWDWHAHDQRWRAHDWDWHAHDWDWHWRFVSNKSRNECVGCW